MLKKGLGLVALLGLASLSLAQTTTDVGVQVNIPSIFTVSASASYAKFDFTLGPHGTTTRVGGVDYPIANRNNYSAFLNSANGPRDFVSSQSTQLTVSSNQTDWTLSLRVNGTLPAPLSLDRLKVYVEKAFGKGQILTNGVTPVPTDGSDLPIARAIGDGQGTSNYNVYYLITLYPTDSIPSDYSAQLTITYVLTPAL